MPAYLEKSASIQHAPNVQSIDARTLASKPGFHNEMISKDCRHADTEIHTAIKMTFHPYFDLSFISTNHENRPFTSLNVS